MSKMSRRMGVRTHKKMMGKKSWITHAQKNQIGEGDIDVKYRVLILLRDHFGLHATMNLANDFAIYINKATGYLESPIGYHSKEAIYKDFWVHYPDLFVKARKVPIIIEIDGPVHWQNAHAVKKTNARNDHYHNSDALFIWLTDLEARDKITKDLILNLSEKLGILPSPVPRKQ